MRISGTMHIDDRRGTYARERRARAATKVVYGLMVMRLA